MGTSKKWSKTYRDNHIGDLKTYYVVERDGKQFVASVSNRKGLPVVRKIEAKNIHEAKMMFWRQTREQERAGAAI